MTHQIELYFKIKIDINKFVLYGNRTRNLNNTNNRGYQLDHSYIWLLSNNIMCRNETQY